ncbi:MAG TPA: hypothetical protein VK809_01415, partial [Bacteroidia bacterium]|nr:hypothetical protein [Bacteroidia bacterium]
VHFLVSAGSVYLILKYAPFNHLQKVLLSFSYFVCFEYSIIARGYALTVFFIFLFCSLYRNKSKNRYLILSLVLFFMANTTGVHGVIMTLSLLGMMVVDYYFTEDTTIRKKYKPMQLLVGVLVVLIGIYIAVKWISPPADSDRSTKWLTGFDSQRFRLSIETFWMSFCPLPNTSTVNFWNSTLIYQKNINSMGYYFFVLLSIAIILFCIALYSKKLSIAVFYLAATCGVLLLSYSNNTIYILFAARYYGFLFITFIASAWLAADVKKTSLIIPGLNSLRTKLKIEKNFTYLLTGLLAINMLGAVIAYGKDYSLPFSEIKVAGDYINEHHLNKLPATGYIDYAVSPISAFTKQSIYFPDRDTTNRYTTWGVSRFSFDPNIVMARITKFVSQQRDSVLFISTGDYFGIGEGKIIGKIQFTKLTSFTGGVVPDETYILYIARNFDLSKLMNDPASYKNPATVNSIILSVNELIQGGKLDDAEKTLTTIAEKTNGKAVPHLHNYLGMVYTKRNMPAEAKKEFNTEIALNLQKEEAFFNLGILNFQDKDYGNAIKDWDSTISINPKNADACYNMGIAYLNAKGNTKTAETCFEKAVEINPNYTLAYYNVLSCAQNLNDRESLIKYIRILLDKGISIDDIKAKGITVTDDLLKKVNAR